MEEGQYIWLTYIQPRLLQLILSLWSPLSATASLLAAKIYSVRLKNAFM